MAAYRLPRYPEDWGLPSSDVGYVITAKLHRTLQRGLKGLKLALHNITVDEEEAWIPAYLNDNQVAILNAIAAAYDPIRQIIDENQQVGAWDRSHTRRVALYALAGVACISIGLGRRDAWKIVHSRD